MTLSLVPYPAAVDETGGAPFVLTPETPITGGADAVASARALIEVRTGLRLGRRSTLAEEGGIHLTVDGVGAPESYRLEASSRGVTVAGADTAGLFYGVQTLGQLLTDTGEVPAVGIDDAPRYAYRGVMLDVARHFHPVETVLAYVDRAATLKFNHLHLHLTDDQGWRLEIASHPELTALGSGTSIGGEPGGCYTQDDYRRIVAYAAARHVTVVPEIDLPGHTHAVSLSHPELCEPPVLSEHIREITALYGGELPVLGEPYQTVAVGFSSLRIDDERTYALLADVLGELAALTPGPYLHIGGDEALGTPPDRYAAFVERVTAMVVALGKTPMAWHEAGAAAGLAPGTVGQYWGFVEPTAGMDDKTRAIVARGGRVVLSPADAVYLDMKPSSYASLGLTWANGPTSLERSYRWDPDAVVDGVSGADVLGVEAPLWTETVRDLADVDALAFPRIGSAAEAAWTPVPYGEGERTWESFAQRIAGLPPLWRALGFGTGGFDAHGLGADGLEAQAPGTNAPAAEEATP